MCATTFFYAVFSLTGSPGGRKDVFITLSHFGLVAGFCRAVDFRTFCAKAKHWITFLLFLCTIWFLCSRFCEETVNRVTITGTASFLKL